MNRVDLTPYPFPEGMEIPRLMPEQAKAFNGDGYLAAEVLRLKEAHGLTIAYETGTCLASTALWLGDNFELVWTYESNAAYYAIAARRIDDKFPETGCNIVPLNIDSVTGLRGGLQLTHDKTKGTFMFLDAHWGANCPLLEELAYIAHGGIKPCIVIHDFQVPGTDFGFDRFPDSGYPFSLEAIAPHLDKIYGEGKWKHNYPTKVEGARRGWISIEPDVHR